MEIQALLMVPMGDARNEMGAQRGAAAAAAAAN